MGEILTAKGAEVGEGREEKLEFFYFLLERYCDRRGTNLRFESNRGADFHFDLEGARGSPPSVFQFEEAVNAHWNYRDSQVLDQQAAAGTERAHGAVEILTAF